MGSSPKDERVSLHPLNPREALKALLGTKPQNGGNQRESAKEPATKPARSKAGE